MVETKRVVSRAMPTSFFAQLDPKTGGKPAVHVKIPVTGTFFALPLPRFTPYGSTCGAGGAIRCNPSKQPLLFTLHVVRLAHSV